MWIDDERLVKVEINQGSVLSPLLFVIVMDETTDDTRDALKKLCYEDDLVLLRDSWKKVEMKYPWLSSFQAQHVKEEYKEIPFWASNVTVGCSIKDALAYKSAYSKIDFVCKKSFSFTGSTYVDEEVTLDGDVTEKIAKFPHLGDVLTLGWVQEAVTVKIRFERKKFKNIASVSFKKVVSLKLWKSLYKSSMKSASCYGAKCWASRTTEMKMLHMICGKTPRDDITICDLTGMKTEEFTKEHRLNWFGHVERKDYERTLLKTEKNLWLMA